MKIIVLIPLLLISLCSAARKQVLVETGTVTTVPGVGGEAEVAYAFAKGDVISLQGQASKKLERMVVLIYPQEELGRHLGTKSPKYTVTMPHDGIVIFRFISDRGGTNKVSYTVTRMPASDEVQDYDTRVVWEKPAPGIPGDPVPKRAAE